MKAQHKHKNKKKKTAFTMIELLVVIAVIGLLAAVALVSMNAARMKARIAKARADVKSLAVASNLFADDVGKWPNGCVAFGPQAPSSFSLQPLLTVPVAGSGSLPCRWTVAEVAKWQGPYIQANGTVTLTDPFGGEYLIISASILGDPNYPAGTMLINSCGPDNSCAGTVDNIATVLQESN